MAERMVVVVKPTGDQQNLTVEDAMRQVLDVFDLLAITPSDTGQEVVWRLIEAKTSSPPFTVTAEAAAKPGTDVDPQLIDRAAREKKRRLANEVHSFQQGKLPESWEEARAQRIVSDLLQRIRHGILVEVAEATNQTPTFTIGEREAILAEKVLELPVADAGQIKDQMGTVEGVLIEVTTWWNRPAIVISEGKTHAKVTCIIDKEQSEKIAGTFEDVWSHRRVAVRGMIRYGKLGDIKRVEAIAVMRREVKDIPDDRIKDRDFTNGLSAAEYVARLREGDIG